MNASAGRGIALFNKGLYREACAAFDRALAGSPEDRGLLLLRAHARRAAGDARGARADLRRAGPAPKASGPARAQADLVAGQRLLEQGKAEEAARVLSRALRLDPRLSLARFHRGEAYSRLGLWKPALRDLGRAGGPAPVVSRRREDGLPRAQKLLEAGRRAAAYAAVERILAGDPESGGARALRGILKRLDGDLAGALADFRRALPAEPEELWRRGFGEEDLRRWEPGRAASDHERVKALRRARPRDPVLLAMAGLAERRWGRWDEGVRALLAAERLAPGPCRQARQWAAKHLCWKAETLLFSGDSKGSLACLGRAVRLSGGAGWARGWRAAVLLWLGRYREALAETDAALSSRGAEWTPDSRAWALGWRGAALFKLGRTARAVAELERAVLAHPGDAESRVWLAEALLASGRRSRALAEAARARRDAPASPWPHVLEALARPRAAGACLARAGRLCPGLLARGEDAREILRRAAGNRTLQPSFLEGSGRAARVRPLFLEAA